jgi:hypothetical protein
VIVPVRELDRARVPGRRHRPPVCGLTGSDRCDACRFAATSAGPRWRGLYVLRLHLLRDDAPLRGRRAHQGRLLPPGHRLGYLTFADSSPAAGKACTDDGQVHEHRGLKGRNKGRPNIDPEFGGRHAESSRPSWSRCCASTSPGSARAQADACSAVGFESTQTAPQGVGARNSSLAKSALAA